MDTCPGPSRWLHGKDAMLSMERTWLHSTCQPVEDRALADSHTNDHSYRYRHARKGRGTACETGSSSDLLCQAKRLPRCPEVALFCSGRFLRSFSPMPRVGPRPACLPVSLCLSRTAAGVHSPPGLPVAGSGQGGDQRDEGAEGAQREHAPQHPAQPRGPPFPGEGPGQRGERARLAGEKGCWGWAELDTGTPSSGKYPSWEHVAVGIIPDTWCQPPETAQHCDIYTPPPFQPRVPRR